MSGGVQHVKGASGIQKKITSRQVDHSVIQNYKFHRRRSVRIFFRFFLNFYPSLLAGLFQVSLHIRTKHSVREPSIRLEGKYTDLQFPDFLIRFSFDLVNLVFRILLFRLNAPFPF